jgi:hypothetical protein
MGFLHFNLLFNPEPCAFSLIPFFYHGYLYIWVSAFCISGKQATGQPENRQQHKVFSGVNNWEAKYQYMIECPLFSLSKVGISIITDLNLTQTTGTKYAVTRWIIKDLNCKVDRALLRKAAIGKGSRTVISICFILFSQTLQFTHRIVQIVRPGE